LKHKIFLLLFDLLTSSTCRICSHQ